VVAQQQHIIDRETRLKTEQGASFAVVSQFAARQNIINNFPQS
jgi:hypothetical protein